MQENIDKALGRFVDLNLSELKEFKNAIRPIRLKKNDILLKEGKIANQLYFVEEGIIEMYKVDEEGDEISLDFFFPNSFAGDYVSYLTRTPCISNIRAISSSNVLVLEKKMLANLYERSIKFQKLGRIIAENSLVTLVS